VEDFMNLQKFGAFIAIAAVTAIWAGSASARTIKTCGKGGTGCITTQVRSTPLGEQYRASNGNWRYCQGDCRDTLRRRYLEFWLRHGG
jgi:hypothetical protein